jgi:hypothetical protein
MIKTEWYKGKDCIAEHLVYLDSKAKELEKLLNGEKSMIIRGANGKKCPLGGRAKINDIVYFVESNGSMIVTHKAIISDVIESYNMTLDETKEFIKKYEKKLNLSKAQYDRWSAKKCLAVYEITNIEEIIPFKYNRQRNMDDWVITDDITKLKETM